MLLLILVLTRTSCTFDSSTSNSPAIISSLSEKEIDEMLIGSEGKTAFEVMEALKDTGFTISCYQDGNEMNDFDANAFYLKNDAMLLYKNKEIRLILLPVDMYLYSGYEERLSEIGDIIELGSYEQDHDETNGKETIKWIVLDTDGTRFLLCSLYILDNQRYDGTFSTAPLTTWETCSLRDWLNDAFINEAFTKEEQATITLTSVVTNGNTTKDKLFLLSYDETWHYFYDASLRQAAGTHYAKANELSISSKTGMSSWWLRTQEMWGIGEKATHTFVVNANGLHENSPPVNAFEGIRPALWVDIDLLD